MNRGERPGDVKRAKYREQTIEYLKNQGLVQKVVEDANKIADLANDDMDSVKVMRLTAASEIRLKLIRKFLPDLKAMELTGEGGGPVKVYATPADEAL